MIVAEDKEIWKSVGNFEGLYEISSEGRVRSLDRIVDEAKTDRYQDGRCFVRKGKLLKPAMRPNGYLFIGLYSDGHRSLISIHKLVMDAFVGPVPDGMERCHNDGNAQNNRLSNLRYDTSIGNHADRMEHGTLPFGSRISWAKLDEEAVILIRSACANGQKQKDLAKQFGVHPSIISAAVTRRKWAHVQ
jgi:hypothetical protein